MPTVMRRLLVAACVLLASHEAWAQLPRTISYQGVLADAAGNLVPDGNHTLTLTLYDAASGGSAVFTETQSVPVVRGVFNSILGSATAGGIPPGALFDRAYFLGISVDGGAELVPRTVLTASPYALRASVADAVTDLAITNAKIADGTITPGKIATTGAAAGQALTFNGSTLAYGNPALKLPYTANVSSASTLLSLTNSGSGIALVAAAVSGYGLYAISNGVGSTAVYGGHPNGMAILGESSSNSAGAVVGRNDTGGYGIYGVNTGSGDGVYGEVSGSGLGVAGAFRNANQSNNNATVRVSNVGLGPVLYVEQNNIAAAGDLAIFVKNGANRVRFDHTGKGFFNGGTQTGGADVAEAFETTEPIAAYEPGDVLVISTTRNRTVERSTGAYSTRVAGVYATKPGVLLTESSSVADQTDTDLRNPDLRNTVPMGIVGVIPTKVSGENGSIQRGDLLVTSSTPGHAMRAGAQPAAGTIIGKALEPFEGAGTGRINVLVSIR
jgi:hypothetical protein